MRRLPLVGAMLLSILANASIASAHEGATAYVIVPSDFVLPGKPFEVVVADVGQDAPVEFSITSGQRTELLGSTRAAPDGHLMTDLLLPTDFPVGYAQLFATVPEVISASTWVLVGERTSNTPPPPSTSTAAPWWTDPSVLVLGALLIGAVGVLGYLVFKPKPPRVPVAPVSAPVTSRRRARKRSPG